MSATPGLDDFYLNHKGRELDPEPVRPWSGPPMRPGQSERPFRATWTREQETGIAPIYKDRYSNKIIGWPAADGGVTQIAGLDR